MFNAPILGLRRLSQTESLAPSSSLPPTSEGKSDLSWCNLPARTRCQLGLQPQEELTPPTEGKRSISLFDSLNLSAGAWCENVDMRDLTV